MIMSFLFVMILGFSIPDDPNVQPTPSTSSTEEGKKEAEQKVNAEGNANTFIEKDTTLWVCGLSIYTEEMDCVLQKYRCLVFNPKQEVSCTSASTPMDRGIGNNTQPVGACKVLLSDKEKEETQRDPVVILFTPNKQDINSCLFAGTEEIVKSMLLDKKISIELRQVLSTFYANHQEPNRRIHGDK